MTTTTETTEARKSHRFTATATTNFNPLALGEVYATGTFAGQAVEHRLESRESRALNHATSTLRNQLDQYPENCAEYFLEIMRHSPATKAQTIDWLFERCVNRGVIAELRRRFV